MLDLNGGEFSCNNVADCYYHIFYIEKANTKEREELKL